VGTVAYMALYRAKACINALIFILQLFVVGYFPSSDAAGNNQTQALTQESVISNKTNLQKKYYQQALFYYFQQDYSHALKVMVQSKQRLQVIGLSPDNTSRLFTAGLQVNMGLQDQAKQALLSFDKQTANQTINQDAQALLLVALLSLTEQYIEQDEIDQAQQTLAKITQVPTASYQQYHVLSQLAFWPKQPVLLPPFTQEEQHTLVSSPYIQLNKALRLLEQEDFQPAVILLEKLKKDHWQAPKQSFWQLLFSGDLLSDYRFSDKSLSNNEKAKKQQERQLQHQAVNDYAQLLLAQVYVQQEQYEQAFYQLKTFPQHSPYTESALFLFAFSAQQIKQYTISLSLLTLLHQQYPYSSLGWQAGELMANQITDQQGLAQGWQAYQKVEAFFLDKLKKIDEFEQSFVLTKNNDSIWLQQALFDAKLHGLYQQLDELNALEQKLTLLTQKSSWLAETIELNEQRKQRLAASQKMMAQQAVFAKLSQKRENLAAVLTLAVADPQRNGFAFANETEQRLLDRLNRSKKSLAFLNDFITETDDTGSLINTSLIKSLINKQSISDYQQRLARIESVLTWQLKQQFSQRAWQHKQQLSALDKQLDQTNNLHKRIARLSGGVNANNTLATEQNILIRTSMRQQQVAKQLTSIATKRTVLSKKITVSINKNVASYLSEQRNILAQHLLSTRREMASVLERMAEQDKKIESQLNLSLKAGLKASLNPSLNLKPSNKKEGLSL